MNTYGYCFSFDDPDGWENPAVGLRVKRVVVGSLEARLVEMQVSAKHPEWCEVGHGGCVVEGVLEVEFNDRVARYGAGDEIAIPPGVAHRHRPRAVSCRVRMMLVDLPG